MRIVGGRWAGRDLVSPGRKVRATAEPVRAAWMDHLGDRLKGAHVLDLFAGSGALGLEALSRGGRHVDFVDNGDEALHALKANLAALRVGPPPPGWRPSAGAGSPSGREVSHRLFTHDAIPFTERLEEGTYDLALADPPYGSAKLDRILAAWRTTRFASVLAVEHAADHALPRGGRRLEFDGTAVTVFGAGR